jgi:hypothetical protein
MQRMSILLGPCCIEVRAVCGIVDIREAYSKWPGLWCSKARCTRFGEEGELIDEEGDLAGKQLAKEQKVSPDFLQCLSSSGIIGV